MKTTRGQGFTLIEAAVVLAVVAILSGIVVPLVVKNLDDSRRARATNDVQLIAAALSSQLKDTATRPCAAVGPGGASGSGTQFWASGPAGLAGYPAGLAVSNAGNLLLNLLSLPGSPDSAQALFALPQLGTSNSAQEFAYKGPYLSSDAALKVDPWGTRYLVLGYNAQGQAARGPIWVVCAGPDRTILSVNSPTAPPETWLKSAASLDDIVVRVQ